MIAGGPPLLSSEETSRNSNEGADNESEDSQFECGGIVREDDLGDRLLKAKRLAEIPAKNAAEKVDVLNADGPVEAEGVAKLGEVFGAGAFAEHLLNGIAGDEMSEQENHGDDEPQGGERKQDALEDAPEHIQERSFLPPGIPLPSFASWCLISESAPAAVPGSSPMLPPE